MERTYWYKQTAEKPLFPDLLWSRPEHASQSGKLLVVGGNLHGFSAPAQAYVEAGKAGVGLTRVLLPDAVKKIAGQIIASVDYAPSTPSGSFSQQALAELLDHCQWADGVLFAGDFGRNSETAILLEKFVSTYEGQLTMAKDSLDYFSNIPKLVLERPNTALVLTMAQLQKLAIKASYEQAFVFSMGLLQLVEALHTFTTIYPVNIILKHLENIVVASAGQVSSTKLEKEQEIWRVPTAAKVSVWWLQNPKKPFEALTTSIIE